MAGIGADCALMRPQRRGKEGEIRLRAADEKVNVRVRPLDLGANQIARAFADRVLAVAGRLIEIGFRHARKNPRMRALQIIAFKTNHIALSSKMASSESSCVSPNT